MGRVGVGGRNSPSLKAAPSSPSLSQLEKRAVFLANSLTVLPIEADSNRRFGFLCERKKQKKVNLGNAKKPTFSFWDRLRKQRNSIKKMKGERLSVSALKCEKRGGGGRRRKKKGIFLFVNNCSMLLTSPCIDGSQ